MTFRSFSLPFVERFNQVEFPAVQWLLPVAVTLHMVEEVIWLPAWSQTAGGWHVPVGWGQFAVASAVLVALAFAGTVASARSGRESAAVYLTMGLALVMLINVFYPHVGATIDLGRYAPGVVTGVLINLPLMPYLLRRAFRDGYVSRKRFLLAAGPMLLLAAGGWSFLFVAGAQVMALLNSP